MTTAHPMPALLDGDALVAPAPGWFRRRVEPDHLVAPGDVIGELEVLGRLVPVTAPQIRGLVQLPPGEQLARRPVAYGDVLVRVVAGELGTVAAAPGSADGARAAAHGLVFRAPTSGRFYGRPAPDKPPFVEVGREVTQGTTMCLLEVMKTFHRVTYGGADVPARARVRELLVTEGADVNAGDPLVALEPLVG